MWVLVILKYLLREACVASALPAHTQLLEVGREDLLITALQD